MSILFSIIKILIVINFFFVSNLFSNSKIYLFGECHSNIRCKERFSSIINLYAKNNNYIIAIEGYGNNNANKYYLDDKYLFISSSLYVSLLKIFFEHDNFYKKKSIAKLNNLINYYKYDLLEIDGLENMISKFNSYDLFNSTIDIIKIIINYKNNRYYFNFDFLDIETGYDFKKLYKEEYLNKRDTYITNNLITIIKNNKGKNIIVFVGLIHLSYVKEELEKTFDKSRIISTNVLKDTLVDDYIDNLEKSKEIKLAIPRICNENLNLMY